MVQKKVLSCCKLGIRITKEGPHQIYPDSGSGSGSSSCSLSGHSIKTTFTPSPPHHNSHPDGKTTSRLPDLRKNKKMKRSGSIKRSNMNPVRSMSSFPFSVEVPQPGKPPPVGVQDSNSASTKLQKQPHADGLPNYMKPTSSSYARKECSSVSPPSTQVGSSTKSPRTTASPSRINSKAPLRNLNKSLSSKIRKTLTKTPSFKPVRPSSAKRCSTVILCADMNPQRATCSSALKDVKFPRYLALSPGATEAEGTSAMKICPYTYCSLNGHRHSPLPPLKCFISSRRRAIKTQRDLKLEALNTNTEQTILDDGNVNMEADDGKSFFINIWADTDNNDMFDHESIGLQAKELEVSEEVDLPISLLGEALYFVSSEGMHRSENETPESLEEVVSVFSDMECDGDTICDADEAVEHSTKNEDMPRAQKPEECPHILLLGWKTISDKEVQQNEEEQARSGGDGFLEDQASEISELNQSIDCASYEHYSSSEEDELIEDIEEIVEFTTGEPRIDDTESIGNEPQQNEDDDIAGYCFEQETESSISQSQCLCQQEGTAMEAEGDDGQRPREKTRDLFLSQEQQSHISHLRASQNLETSAEVEEKTAKTLAVSEDPTLEVDQDDEGEHIQSSITKETPLKLQEANAEKLKSKYARLHRTSEQDPVPSMNWIGKNVCKRMTEEEMDPGRFNPREPNYLPVVPGPEAEKVDLRHQTMDERRQSDEWMIDYALRQTVTKLGPARKRKVALLVEAFEKVIPVPKVTNISKWETLLTSPRPIQACS